MENHFQFTSLNGNAIIKDESALIPQYFEGQIFCKRDIEEKIISAIKPITQTKPSQNLFLYGPIGAGKTVLVRHILDHLRDYNRKVLCVYINCWYQGTSMAIYNKIADALGEKVSRRGRATDEIFNRIVELMRYQNTPILLVLDNIDALLYRHDERILHNIAGMNGDGVLFGVICVSEYKNVLTKLHPRIRSDLRFTPLEVKGWTKEQLLELLKSRADKGLAPGSYSDPVLERIAEAGEENKGNGKLTMEILWKAAKTAEEKRKASIDLEDVEETINQIYYQEPALAREEQIIINILKTGEKNSSEVYWSFCKKLRRTKNQIRTYLKSLKQKGIIEIRDVQSRYTLNFKLIRLKNRGDSDEG